MNRYAIIKIKPLKSFFLFTMYGERSYLLRILESYRPAAEHIARLHNLYIAEQCKLDSYSPG